MKKAERKPYLKLRHPTKEYKSIPKAEFKKCHGYHLRYYNIRFCVCIGTWFSHSNFRKKYPHILKSNWFFERNDTQIVPKCKCFWLHVLISGSSSQCCNARTTHKDLFLELMTTAVFPIVIERLPYVPPGRCSWPSTRLCLQILEAGGGGGLVFGFKSR